MTETYLQVQTAGLAEEKGLIDTEEEEGQVMGTILSLGICPCLDSQAAEELPFVLEGQSEGRKAWIANSLFTLRLEAGDGNETGVGEGKLAEGRCIHLKCTTVEKVFLALLARSVQ